MQHKNLGLQNQRIYINFHVNIRRWIVDTSAWFIKFVLALVYASTRLCRYFQGHNIFALTTYPLQQVLRKPDMLGRLAKWVTTLNAFEIDFKSRAVVKGNGQVERVNKSMLEGIKKRLTRKGAEHTGLIKKWSKPTLIRFIQLDLRVRRMLPAEIEIPSAWSWNIQEKNNDHLLHFNLNLLGACLTQTTLTL